MAIRKKGAGTPRGAGLTSLTTSRNPRGTGVVRIVGGDWRRTPVAVVSHEGLRPTSERVRETVFDWMTHLVGSLVDRRVLDLFAGSGALGLEAASRGAREVDWVECDRTAAAGLRATLERLKAGSGRRVHTADAFAFLQTAGTYDLVFVDPPFARELQVSAVRDVLGHLAPEGLIYVENPSEVLPLEVLERLGLVRVRSGSAGAVAFELLARAGSRTSSLAKLTKEEKRALRKGKATASGEEGA